MEEKDLSILEKLNGFLLIIFKFNVESIEFNIVSQQLTFLFDRIKVY